LKCRPIGVIEGEQIEGNTCTRNDRIVAVARDNHSYASIEHIDDLGKPFVRELASFFVNYHELAGNKYRIVGIRGPKTAHKHIQKGMKAYRRKLRDG
jgi:inorganic pyrophosphatase